MACVTAQFKYISNKYLLQIVHLCFFISRYISIYFPCLSFSASGMPLELLVPRLWPFLKHLIRSVRQATLDTLHALVQQTGAVQWLAAILPDTLQLIYQRCLLEPNPDILNMVYKVNTTFLSALFVV